VSAAPAISTIAGAARSSRIPLAGPVRHTLHVWVGVWLSSIVLVLAAPAAADERPLTDAITIARGDDCLQHELLVPHVRMWLSSDALDADISVVVSDQEEGASFVVTRGGEAVAARTFDRLPVACVDRRAAVGLAIAIALDEAALEGVLEGGREAPERASRGLAVALELVVEGQLLVEVLPEVAGAAQIGARVVFDESVELALHAWTTSVSGADLAEGRVSAQLAAGRLDLCVRRRIDSVVLRGCAAGAVGAAFAEGLGVAGARQATVGFAGVLARFGVGFLVTEWLALEIAADGWLDVWRPRFDLVDEDGNAVVSTSLPLGGLIASAGASLRF
jgi:hypothetical protein